MMAFFFTFTNSAAVNVLEQLICLKDISYMGVQEAAHGQPTWYLCTIQNKAPFPQNVFWKMVTKTKQIYNGFMSRMFSRVVQSTTCVNISSSPLYRGRYRCEHLQDVQSLGELVCLRVYNWNLNRRFVLCISSRSFQLKVGTGENCTFFGDTVLQMQNTRKMSEPFAFSRSQRTGGRDK